MLKHFSVCMYFEKVKDIMEREKESFELMSVAGDGHCICQCFAEELYIPLAYVLQTLWDYFEKKCDSYLEASTYNSKEELLKALGDYLFAKKYGQEVVDFVVFALSEIYKLRVYIFIDTLENLPNHSICEHFQKSIYLLKRNDHYDLAKKIEEHSGSAINLDADENL